MELKGNKGEWSEIYTLFKLLGDTQVCGGDAYLKRIEDVVYPIIKIIRKECDSIFNYEVNGNVIIVSSKDKTWNIPIESFKAKALILFEEITKSVGTTFSINEIEAFMNSFCCHKIKADSYDKSDIKIIIHDFRTGLNPLLGFSIKSQLGGNSTLFNASRATNFCYEILGADLSNADIAEINSINTSSKIRDRIALLIEKGVMLSYKHIDCSTFRNNLVLIDSSLPIILAEVLKIFYTTKMRNISDIVHAVELENPLNFDSTQNHKFYEYKIKKFLTDIALGMVPTKIWDGKYDATGGYLVVKKDGDIICYHIYNKNEFENYLFNNTHLETPSSTRNNFGQVMSINDEMFFKLNLQIRFNS